MNINQYIREYSTIQMEMQVCPLIYCTDGFNMSVQAGETHYSTPKKHNADHYESVEIGFPSVEEPLISEYVESTFDDQPPKFTETVYPYVPVEIVDKVLEKHGGIDFAETLVKHLQNNY